MQTRQILLLVGSLLSLASLSTAKPLERPCDDLIIAIENLERIQNYLMGLFTTNVAGAQQTRQQIQQLFGALSTASTQIISAQEALPVCSSAAEFRSIDKRQNSPCDTLEKVATDLNKAKDMATKLAAAAPATLGIDGPTMTKDISESQEHLKAASKSFKGSGVCK